MTTTTAPAPTAAIGISPDGRRIDALLDAIGRVLALHRQDGNFCPECIEPCPCPTVRTLQPGRA